MQEKKKNLSGACSVSGEVLKTSLSLGHWLQNAQCALRKCCVPVGSNPSQRTRQSSERHFDLTPMDIFNTSNSDRLSDYDYSLPKGLIANKALVKRDNSRLMVVGDKIEHKHFSGIVDYLNAGDVLIINETKVIKAKLVGKKSTGAPCEIIIEFKREKDKNSEEHDDTLYACRIKSRGPKIGSVFELNDKLVGKVIDRDDDFFYMSFNKDPTNTIKKYGQLLQPTYIKRKITEEEYQTIYANKPGSLAAPTAGLHFTKSLIKKLEKKGVIIARVCLHIGFGTFLPINSENISEHKIHTEYFEISKDAADKINTINTIGTDNLTTGNHKLVVVGTTSLRAIESADYVDGKIQPTSGKTEIFIRPGYIFKSKTSILLTNFHLPKSTLLLMVSAFAGREKVLYAYREAIKNKYRFYSLGDACLFFNALS